MKNSLERLVRMRGERYLICIDGRAEWHFGHHVRTIFKKWLLLITSSDQSKAGKENQNVLHCRLKSLNGIGWMEARKELTVNALPTEAALFILF